MLRLPRVHVLRISKTGIASASFAAFDPGVASWVKMNGLDRTDYPAIPFSGEPKESEIRNRISVAISRFPKEGTLVIGVPGPVRLGKLVFCPTIPNLVEVLESQLQKSWLGQRIVGNNTDFLASAEVHQGVLRSSADVSAIIITLGSGIGSAMVRLGQVDLGDLGSGGEIGHVVIDPEGLHCPCGRRGCLEQYTSGEALERQAQEDGIVVSQASDLANIPKAEHIVSTARKYMALSLATAITFVHTRNLVFGGNLVPIYEPEAMKKEITNLLPPFIAQDHGVNIKVCKFSPTEGVLLGGAFVGFEIEGVPQLVLTTRE